MFFLAASRFWSFVSDIPTWGWFDVVFTLMVLAGVMGETAWVLKFLVRDKPLDLMPVKSKRKKVKKFAGFFLIFGLAGEVICLGFSVWESSTLNKDAADARLETERLKQQIAETRTNLDPRNATVSFMYATVLLQVKGTQFNDLTNWNPNHVALITLCQNDVRHIPNFDWLDADTYKKGEYHNMFDTAGRGYAIHFQSWGFLPGMGIKSKVRDLDAVNLLRMEVNFLPRGAEISGGGVELVANNLHKVFAILPQTDTNFPDGTPGAPYIVLATNWDNEMK